MCLISLLASEKWRDFPGSLILNLLSGYWESANDGGGEDKIFISWLLPKTMIGCENNLALMISLLDKVYLVNLIM